MAGPSTEQLALSAALFTSTIDAWIPASFGPKPTAADQTAQFDQRLRAAALQGDHDRLGAGHPDAGVYKPRGGPSLSSLERKLGKVDRKGKATSPVPLQQQRDDSDEEESRTRSIGRKKVNPVADLLRGKKSRKGKEEELAGPTVHPLLNLSNSAFAGTNDPTPVQGTTTPLTGTTSSPGGSGTFPFQGPLAVDSSLAKQQTSEKPTTRKRPRESTETDVPGPILRLEPSGAGVQGAGQVPHAEDKDPAESDTQSEAKLSKTQRRRDARKRAKLARQE